jgi:cytochrome c551/c552
MGCGGGSDSNTASGTKAPAKTAAANKSEGASDIGVGPISKVDVASLTTAHSEKGKEIFDSKCTACHKLEERYIGPALAGVTERRKPEWIMNMIMNPDVMVKEDPQAKALFAEYLAPMTNQNLSEDEAKSLLAFLISVDNGSQ